MKTYLKFYIIFILFSSVNLFSQRETENWYFGNYASLNFSDNILNITNNSNAIAPKGCSSISDKEGNLLFYTNGSEVFNKNHKRMSAAVKLESDSSTSQNSIIIPKPGSTTIFYIFTVKTEIDPPPLLGKSKNVQNLKDEPIGLYYSIIDITRNNNLGEIIESNILIQENVAEKISAVHHKNGRDIWIITHGKESSSDEYFNMFYSILVTPDNINPAVKSDLGEQYLKDKKGYIKLSPNGEHIGLATFSSGAMLLNFDNENGAITNPRRLILIRDLEIGLIMSAYGVAFSQNSKKVYFQANKSSGGSRLFQFDIEKSLTDPSFDELIEINRNSGALQLAYNGKIYNVVNDGETALEGSEYLSEISNAENEDFIFREDIIDLSTVNNQTTRSAVLSRLGLPNFIQSYFRTRIISETGCVDYDFIPEIDTYTTIQSAFWDFGDGNTSDQIAPTHQYKSVGKYLLKATIYINDYPLSIEKEIEIFPFEKLLSSKNIIQCDSGIGENYFNLTEIENKVANIPENYSFNYFETFENAELNIEPISEFENYKSEETTKKLFVKATNELGCSDITSFTIDVASVNLGDINEIYACGVFDESSNTVQGIFDLGTKRNQIKEALNLDNSTIISFYESFNNAQTKTNSLSDSHQLPNSKIWVRADTPLGCGGIESFDAIVNTLPITNNINSSYTICFDPNVDPITLKADLSNERFEWRNSSGDILNNSPEFRLSMIGDYSLTVYKTENGMECSNIKEFSVINPPKPVVTSVVVNIEDEKNVLVSVNVQGNSSYEFSLDNVNFFGNSTNYTFSQVQNGLRTIYIKDVNNCEEPIQAKASVLGYPPFFTPNNDNMNDYWNINGLDSSLYKSLKITIFNRFGSVVKVISDFNSDGWDGNYHGKQLASNSFWFTAEIVDNEDNILKKSGSFSLVRN